MGHRINERNIGHTSLEGEAKKRGKKLNSAEIEVVKLILNRVYDAMDKDESLGVFVDGGRITIGLSGEQMYDLFEAKRKL